MSWFRRRPRPPVNVRLEDPHGNVVKLQVQYVGRENGIHIWEATTWVHLYEDTEYQLRMDVLPARTQVRCKMPTAHRQPEVDG